MIGYLFELDCEEDPAWIYLLKQKVIVHCEITGLPDCAGVLTWIQQQLVMLLNRFDELRFNPSWTSCVRFCSRIAGLDCVVDGQMRQRSSGAR